MNKDQFEYINKWQNETFPEANTLSKLCHLAIEVKETVDAININHSDKSEVYHEFADCFILLIGAASSYGMSYEDIQRAIYSKMQINKIREWMAPNPDGTVFHKK